MLVYSENNGSSCSLEGSNVTYSCWPGLIPSERRMAQCMKDGSWIPNPNEMECRSMEEIYATNSSTLVIAGNKI